MAGIIIENEENQQSSENKSSLNFGTLYLGVFCLALGVVYVYGLRQALGFTFLISFSQLWPLALIATGLSIFSASSSRAMSIMFFITILAVGLSLAIVLVPEQQVNTKTLSSVVPLNPGWQEAKLNLSTMSSRVNIQSGNSQNLVENLYESNYASLEFDSFAENNIAQVNLTQNLMWGGIGAYYKNFTTKLNTQTPFNIRARLSASDLVMNLTEVKLKSLEVSLSGSTASIQLGQITDETSLSVDSQLSALTIIIPKDVLVSLSSNDTLTTKNIVGLDRKPDSPGQYISRATSQAGEITAEQEIRKKLNLNLNATASRISIIQE